MTESDSDNMPSQPVDDADGSVATPDGTSELPAYGARDERRPGVVVVGVAVVVMVAFVGLLAYSLLTRETTPAGWDDSHEHRGAGIHAFAAERRG